MECLALSACKRWVKPRGMVYAPHHAGIPYAAQFRVTHDATALTGLASALGALLQRDSNVLVVAEDWVFYRPDEMAAISSLRAAAGEDRPLIDAPGHRFRSSESEGLGHLIRLLVGFKSGWSFYGYSFPSKTTFYFWEGALLDVWTKRGAPISTLGKALERCGKAG